MPKTKTQCYLCYSDIKIAKPMGGKKNKNQEAMRQPECMFYSAFYRAGNKPTMILY